MWCYKLKNIQFSIPWRYPNYRYCSGVTKSSAINQTENTSAKFPFTEKSDMKFAKPELESNVISPDTLKTNPFFTSSIAPVTDNITASFDTIPGPKTLRWISKFWNTVPVFGTEVTVSVIQYLLSGGKLFGGILSWGGNKHFFKKFFDVYGPVVRLHGPFGSDVVLLSRPEHASVIFQNEGTYPIRCCLDSVEKYRLEYRKYRQAGPFLTYGPDWEKVRKAIEQPLQRIVGEKFEDVNTICKEFTYKISAIRNKQEEVSNNFMNEIYKWCLECLCSVTIDRKLGFLDSCDVSPMSEPGRLLRGLTNATEAIRKCEYGFHLWKFVETPAWKSLVKNCDIIDGILEKQIQKAENSLKEKKVGLILNMSLLEILLLEKGITTEDVMTLLLDMFLIGVNATAHTAGFLFYHLARNPRCQMKLYEEIQLLGDKFDKKRLLEMKYLQACIKETLRLDPPIPVLNRRLNNDIAIHNYSIPKGTHILFATHLNGMREEYYEDALKFKPERWLSNELGGFGNDFQAFASMPFGHGPKACLAKELAEIEMALLLVNVCKNYKIEYNYGDIESSNELLATPKKPLKFRFIDRN